MLTSGYGRDLWEYLGEKYQNKIINSEECFRFLFLNRRRGDVVKNVSFGPLTYTFLTQAVSVLPKVVCCSEEVGPRLIELVL